MKLGVLKAATLFFETNGDLDDIKLPAGHTVEIKLLSYGPNDVFPYRLACGAYISTWYSERELNSVIEVLK